MSFNEVKEFTDTIAPFISSSIRKKVIRIFSITNNSRLISTYLRIFNAIGASKY